MIFCHLYDIRSMWSRFAHTPHLICRFPLPLWLEMAHKGKGKGLILLKTVAANVS